MEKGKLKVTLFADLGLTMVLNVVDVVVFGVVVYGCRQFLKS